MPLLGSGTALSPYLVETYADLQLVAIQNGPATTISLSAARAAHYKQTQNIVATSPFTPITVFSGVYDGDGHTITDLYIDTPAQTYAAMFAGAAATTGTIKNLGLINPYVSTANYGAGLVAFLGSNCLISRCFVKNATIVGGTYSGLIFARNTAATNVLIEDSWGTGTLSAGNRGVLGRSTDLITVNRVWGRAARSADGVLLPMWAAPYTGQTVPGGYYESLTSGVVNGGATSKTASELKTQATFSGYDFTNVWKIDAGENDGYPTLRAFGSTPVPTNISSVKVGGTFVTKPMLTKVGGVFVAAAAKARVGGVWK